MGTSLNAGESDIVVTKINTDPSKKGGAGEEPTEIFMHSVV